MRKRSLFKLFEVFYIFDKDFSNEKIHEIFIECCNFIQVNIIDLIEDNFEYLLENWLNMEFGMVKFPWFLVSDSQSNFFNEYRDRIAFSIMRYNWDMLDEFVKLMELRMEELIAPVLSSCIAILLPFTAGLAGMSENYTRNSIIMRDNLYKIFTDDKINRVLNEYAIDVITALLYNLNDEQLFYKLFGFEMKFCCEDHEISMNIFEECLRFIQVC